uniref:Mitogen-activated protein kinase n=1 Tax=Panagrellus redivivus TaxID=6233 RepID=A0A7E4V9Y4_PANRE
MLAFTLYPFCLVSVPFHKTGFLLPRVPYILVFAITSRLKSISSSAPLATSGSVLPSQLVGPRYPFLYNPDFHTLCSNGPDSVNNFPPPNPHFVDLLTGGGYPLAAAYHNLPAFPDAHLAQYLEQQKQHFPYSYPAHFGVPESVFYYQTQPHAMALVSHPSAVGGNQRFNPVAANNKEQSNAAVPKTAAHPVKTNGPVVANSTDSSLVKALFNEQSGYYNPAAPSPSSPTRSRYEPDRPIGYGAFGVVWSVTDPRNHKRVALKKMPNVFQNIASTKRVFREIRMLASFTHDNVVCLLDILQPPNPHFFQEIYVLTELMQSDLHKIIVSPQTLTPDHIKVFLYQILRGLKYLHSAHILHRDIKPGNLLVNSNCVLKICDFGLARLWDPADQINMTHEVVTQYYRAPELLMGSRRYTGAIDVWSVGCIFAELLARRILFQAQGPIEQLNLIIDLLGTPRREEMHGACDGAISHILRSPHRASQVSRLHSLSQSSTPDAVHLLIEMLKFDPDRRLTVEQALEHRYLEEGRMRFHSCMCSCCHNGPHRERIFCNNLDPIHENPISPVWEKEISRLSMFDLRDRLYKYVTDRRPMDGIPLCINNNSASYAEFVNSSVAQPSELPPSPNAWE